MSWFERRDVTHDVMQCLQSINERATKSRECCCMVEYSFSPVVAVTVRHGGVSSIDQVLALVHPSRMS
jgi:hypothetical protein